MRRAMAAETSTLSPRANRATAASSPVTLASAVARKVYGLDSVTMTAYGLYRSGPPKSWVAWTFFSCVWPTFGDASRWIWIGPPFAGMNVLTSAPGTYWPNVNLDIGLGELVGEEALDVVVGQSAHGCAGFSSLSGPTTGPPTCVASRSTPLKTDSARCSRSAFCCFVK